MERFIAVLIEHTGGNFPLWLAFEQVAILPISDKYIEYAQQIAQQLENQGIRVTIDDRSEKTGKKLEMPKCKNTVYDNSRRKGNGEQYGSRTKTWNARYGKYAIRCICSNNK